MGYYQDCKDEDFEIYSGGKEDYVVLKTDEIFYGKNGEIETEVALKDISKPCSFYRFAEYLVQAFEINTISEDLNAKVLEVSRLKKDNWYHIYSGDEDVIYITKDGNIEEYSLTSDEKTLQNQFNLYESEEGKLVEFDLKNCCPAKTTEYISFD